jgi:hypothetical protein
MEHKGTENLIPINKRTPEEAKEITSKGGIASGESKRRRKTFKEIFELLLQEKAIDGSELTNDELISLQMIVEANKGNTKAFEIVRDTIGEKPTDKTETKTEVTINDEDRALLNNLYDRLK